MRRTKVVFRYINVRASLYIILNSATPDIKNITDYGF